MDPVRQALLIDQGMNKTRVQLQHIEMKRQQLNYNYDHKTDSEAKFIKLELNRIAEDLYKSTDESY